MLFNSDQSCYGIIQISYEKRNFKTFRCKQAKLSQNFTLLVPQVPTILFSRQPQRHMVNVIDPASEFLVQAAFGLFQMLIRDVNIRQ